VRRTALLAVCIFSTLRLKRRAASMRVLSRRDSQPARYAP
jgi:hypothetical protein